MARDIEEFLRQAAQRRQERLRQQQMAGQQPPPAQPVQPPPQVKPQVRKWQKTPPIQRVPPLQYIEAEDDRSQVPLQQRHVQTTIDTSEISQKVELLGERIEVVNQLVDSRIQNKFDNPDLGSLGFGERVSEGAEPVEAKVESNIVADLLSAFRNPRDVRNAILLTEVLKRPDFD
ncbi:MAG TPA: hypothetical protein PKD64_15080 [Pirellulaceae bacterium]|nr:hypothetical protein [Pirellulaceae bacterium]HMO93507.1 hypothetical protein [Pirellulaceae bacterium]HMP70412.1 hypothetical protein [Pirellulaceae bacterium]